MSIKVANSRFIVPPLRTAFYQQLLCSVSSFHELGKTLVRQAELATGFRCTDGLEDLAVMLSNIPITEYQLIGQYYRGWKAYLTGEDARSVFESVLEKSRTYKARAYIGLAALEARKGDFESELKFFKKALEYTNTRSLTIESLRGIAIVKAKEGFHKQSLDDLERISPLVGGGNPHSYYQYLNSLAVELGQAGRKHEARSICKVILGSPFIHAYPEWQETATGLKEPDRSFIALSPARKNRRNVLRMPVVEHGDSGRIRYEQPARVVNLQQWKQKVGEGKQPLETPTTLEIINQIVHFYTNKNTTDHQRHKIWEAVEKIIFEPDPPDLDDSGGA